MIQDCITNVDEEQIGEILRQAHRIAVVGASDNPERDSFHIVQFLVEQGYLVLPVNPKYRDVAGLTCYKSLSDLAIPPDIVNVFRRPSAVGEVVEQAIASGVPVIWFQEGVINDAAAQRAIDAGLQVIQNRCIYKEHILRFGT